MVLICWSANPVFIEVGSALFPFLSSQSRIPVLPAWRHGTAMGLCVSHPSVCCPLTSLLPHLLCLLIQKISGFGFFPWTMQVSCLKREETQPTNNTFPTLTKIKKTTKNKGTLTRVFSVWLFSIQSPRSFCSSWILLNWLQSFQTCWCRALSCKAEPSQCSAIQLPRFCYAVFAVCVLQPLECYRTSCNIEKLYFGRHFCSPGKSVSLLPAEINFFSPLLASLFFFKLSNITSSIFLIFLTQGR